MNIGDKVFHVPSQRVLTVRRLPGNNMVGCSWMGVDHAGKVTELTSGFDWRELRTPTPEQLAAEAERMKNLRAPAAAGDASPESESEGDAPAPEVATAGTHAAPGAHAEQKRKRQ